MDLKIEIRKLWALHEATIRLDHAIKEAGETTWRDFTPSRFVYAFFTFNSIYSFDWKSSFEKKNAITWPADEKGRIPTEKKQFKAYFRFADDALKPETSRIVGDELSCRLELYGIEQPIEELGGVDLVNATTELKKLAGQLPGEFQKLLNARVKEVDAP